MRQAGVPRFTLKQKKYEFLGYNRKEKVWRVDSTKPNPKASEWTDKGRNAGLRRLRQSALG